MKLLIVYILLTSTVFGATCKKLSECVELSTQLTGKKIVYDKKILPFTYELNQPLEMNRQNVDKTLSEALMIFGLVRIPTQLKQTEKLIEARDLRFHTDLPTFEASKILRPKIPETQDPVMVNYRGVKGLDAGIVAEKVKPLLSRYGEISPMRDGSIVVIDTGIFMNKIIPFLQKQDYPLTQEEKTEMALQKKREHELEMARLKSGEMHEIGPHKHKE